MTEVVESLPPQPLPESELRSLEAADRIKSATPMMAYGAGSGLELVFNFVLETNGGVHALVLDEDGGGWKSVGDFETVEDAMFAVQAFQEEIGVSLHES